MAWWLAWALLTIAAVTDWRTRRIPNVLFVTGISGALILMGLGQLPWSHFLWALGLWIFAELSLWWRPGYWGWGDVKLATALTALLGSPGWFLVIWGWLGIYAMVGYTWLCDPQHRSWTGQSGPWAPGAWVGGSIMLGFLLFQGRGGI